MPSKTVVAVAFQDHLAHALGLRECLAVLRLLYSAQAIAQVARQCREGSADRIVDPLVLAPSVRARRDDHIGVLTLDINSLRKLAARVLHREAGVCEED